MSAFASDLSYQVFQKRRREGELTTPQTDQSRELAHLQVPCVKFWNAGEGQVWLDTDDAARPEEMVIGFPYTTGRGRSK